MSELSVKNKSIKSVSSAFKKINKKKLHKMNTTI